MPPKGDPKKTKVGGGADSFSGSANGNAVNANDGNESGSRSDSNSAVIPPGSSSSTAGDTLMVDLTKDSAKDKVSHYSQVLEKMFYGYGDQLMQATQDVLARATGIDSGSAEAISSSWQQVRKATQPKLNQCLIQLVDAVPEENVFGPAQEVAHPGARMVAFRDLVENARTDIVGSLDELMQWVLMNLHDPAAITSLCSHKQEAYTKIYDTVLSQMSGAILDRMQEARSTHVDFGRDSDYGQALEAQQTLAKERDDLELQLEGFKGQVEALKASEDDLCRKCQELQEKFSKAEADLLSSNEKVDILEAVTDFLRTDPVNAVGTLVRVKDKHDKQAATINELETKISELESHVCHTGTSVLQDDSARIKDLESQLQAAKDANVNLQKLVAEQQKRIPSGSGTNQSLVGRAHDIGFVFDASGKLQLGPPPSQIFDVSKPYCYASRYGQ